MIIDFNQESASTRYHLLTQTIIPRPIAWILSENDERDGVSTSYNVAPFSFFNAMCSNPPLLVISIGKKLDGHIKDTRHNISSGRDFVVHIAGIEQADAVNNSAATLAYGDSEVHANDLALVEFPGCPLPRLQECHVAYHCRLYDIHEVGPAQQAMVYAEVVQLYLSDEVATEKDGRYTVDAKVVNPLVRLGGTAYAELGEHFSLRRPVK